MHFLGHVAYDGDDVPNLVAVPVTLNNTKICLHAPSPIPIRLELNKIVSLREYVGKC